MINLEELISRVNKLDLATQNFVLFGTAPMLRKGLINSISDIDILARGAAWEKAQQFAEIKIGSKGDKIISPSTDIDIFNGWMGKPVEAIFKKAELIDGLLYANLEDVLSYKLELNRPKDQLHIKLIQAFLKSAAGN